MSTNDHQKLRGAHRNSYCTGSATFLGWGMLSSSLTQNHMTSENDQSCRYTWPKQPISNNHGRSARKRAGFTIIICHQFSKKSPYQTCFLAMWAMLMKHGQPWFTTAQRHPAISPRVDLLRAVSERGRLGGGGSLSEGGIPQDGFNHIFSLGLYSGLQWYIFLLWYITIK